MKIKISLFIGVLAIISIVLLNNQSANALVSPTCGCCQTLWPETCWNCNDFVIDHAYNCRLIEPIPYP